MKYLLFILASVFFIGCSSGDPVALYICHGQSNARPEWADGIMSVLQEDDPNCIVVQANHSGNSIDQWFDVEIQQNYISDLETVKEKIGNNEYYLAGLFWFQGESDRNEYESYSENFIGYLEQLGNDYSSNNFDVVIHYVWYNTMDIEEIRNVQKSLVESYSNIYGFETSGYPRRDGVHLFYDDYYPMGEESAKQYLLEK